MSGDDREDVLSSKDVESLIALFDAEPELRDAALRLLVLLPLEARLRERLVEIPEPQTRIVPLATPGDFSAEGERIALQWSERAPFDESGALPSADLELVRRASDATFSHLVTRLFQQVAETSEDPDRRLWAITSVIGSRRFTPEHIELLDLYERFPAVGAHVAWAAARGGVAPLVREVLKATTPRDRPRAIDFLHEATLELPGRPRRGRERLHGPSLIEDMGPPQTDALEAMQPAEAMQPLEAMQPGDLPRTFFALVETPAHVVVAEPFTVTAGITKDAPAPDATPFVRPDSSTGEYTIVLSVQAPGFILEGNDATFDLPVTHANAFPTIDIRLTPDLQADDRVERTITIFYAIDGQVIGSVERAIAVHVEADDETRAAQRVTWQKMFSVATHGIPPDLTVMITDAGGGKLSWSFITPHASVVVPRNSITSEVGDDTRAFAKSLVKLVNAHEGKPGLYELLVGRADAIKAVMPKIFWPLLKKVSEAAQTKAPSLLIISNEPHIPWELARTSPALDDTLAPFLGVQTCIGRWIVGDRLPPPRALAVRNATVVSGVYPGPRWTRLLKAEEEAKTLNETYGAVAVDATAKKILGVFDSDPPADLLHFSMHGQWEDESIQNGLITIDGGAIAPDMVRGALAVSTKKGAPFVFLNACQVAAGQNILGDYSGIAAEFVRGGATAVIAPLWSVKDDVAKQIALDFYEATLVRGEAPAEVMRRSRALSIKKDDAIMTATYLAYQFFGHPSLRLDGSALPRKDT